ncbi:MAG: hypothetical protein HYV26_06105 [Candidatus Hydrogenedentes bacterium]|nr:hypothetical protein [Candidatus Hydrogenedentota bacterium]
MWNHLEPHSAKLEEVFEPLYEKATAYERLWSIAELRLAEQDIHWLRSWFNYLTPKNTENWIKSVMLTSFPGKAYATYRQMFGSLLICVGAEVCREASREDSVWPTIRGLLPDSHALRRELFLSNGQPSCLTKDLITDAVRSLNLRHAMDLEGTQQWFITIKLQYGFTYRGAKNRLAEWLVNLGSPHAVQYLNSRSVNSELASESFQSLWRALTQYRRDLISEAEIRSTLHSNPWIRAHWIDDLLMEAKARIEVLGVGDWQDADAESVEKGVAQEVFCPISGLALVWPSGKTPRLMIDLDRDAIGEETHETDAQELDIHVDRSKITRWLRQEDGNWSGEGAIYAEPDSKKRQPNLNPRILAVRSPSGETLVEWDFTDSGFSEQVLVFDLDKSRIAKSGEERLEPNRHYAIVCDRKCEIHGCIPVETFDRTGLPKKAIRLPVPLNENICMTYDEFVLWQPVRSPELTAQNWPMAPPASATSSD